MSVVQFGMNPSGLRLVGIGLLQLAALAQVGTLALPARAADERAVRSRVAPVYPEIAKRLKIAGAVKVEATVDPEGNVKEAKAVSGSRMLSPAAEDAVRKWRFAPAAGDATVEVEVSFTVLR